MAREPALRAIARALAAEMHSGFGALRRLPDERARDGPARCR
jgi:hypothetical protein